MKQRAFGATGVTISEIVFGAGAVGGIVFEPAREVSVAAVRRALELGVSWIDTAPQYGKGRSEENLGWILQELGASPRVSTKVRLRPDDCGRFDSLQAYYNVLNPSAGQTVPAGFPGQDFERLIDRAAAAGMGVIVIRALSAGSVLGAQHAHRGAAVTPGSTAERDAELARALHHAVGEYAEGMVDLALRFALMHPGVSGAGVGFSEIPHIEQAAAAAKAGALPEAVFASLSELHESGFA